MLTEKQKAEYIKNPCHCPDCGDHDIEGGPIEADVKTAWQEVLCNGCHFEWTDIYTLTDIEETER